MQKNLETFRGWTMQFSSDGNQKNSSKKILGWILWVASTVKRSHPIRNQRRSSDRGVATFLMDSRSEFLTRYCEQQQMIVHTWQSPDSGRLFERQILSILRLLEPSGTVTQVAREISIDRCRRWEDGNQSCSLSLLSLFMARHGWSTPSTAGWP